jgi:hypothetical protein
MPVPIDRADDAFSAPLGNLQLGTGTELYLGLVHARDGDGTAGRMAAAGKHVSAFGVASECGISRGRDPDLAQAFIEGMPRQLRPRRPEMIRDDCLCRYDRAERSPS